jgi:hypothetical protein
MREPKFSDAWCFGKEFQANSKVCRVCLGNKQCQKLFLKRLGVTPSRTNVLLSGAGARPLKPQSSAGSVSL